MSDDSLYAPLFDDPDPILQQEQRLWISVVMQAAIDAASTNARVKRGVIKWLAHDDFELVCDMAGMSPRYVSYAINAVLAAESQSVAFRKAMSFRFLVRSYIDDNLGDVDKEKNTDRDTLTNSEPA